MYILGSDFDGTLNRGGISPRDREAVARFRAAGNLFGIVTGRDYYMTHTLRDEGLAVDFVLAFNGAMLIAGDGERAGDILWSRSEKNGGVIRWVAEHMGQVYGSPLGCVFLKNRTTFHGACPDGSEKYAPLSAADPMAEYTMLNTWCRTEELAARCVREILDRFGPQAVNPIRNGVCIDIPPVGVNKGEGMARFARERGVPDDCVFCAGDNVNDVAMIARFRGCAVENAAPEAKAAAEAVYPDVAAIIERIMGM